MIKNNLGAAELEAVCATASQHVACGGSSCGDIEGLAGSHSDIDMEKDAVDTTLEKA